MLWTAIRWLSPDNPVYSFSVADKPAPGIGICSGMCLLYSAAMLLAYWVSGCVFRDRHQAGMWVRGAAAAPAIETVFLFPVALLVLVRPEWTEVLLLTALCTFAMGKIMFILKGIRIFSIILRLGCFFVLPLQFRNSTLDPHIRSDIGHLR